MTTKSKVLLAIGAILLSFAAGRYLSPVKIETKVVEVEKKTSETTTEREKRTNKETTKTKTTRPDGTVEETEKTTEKTETTTERSNKNSSDTSKTSEETRTPVLANLTVSGLIAVDINQSLGYDYGMAVTKQLIGPVYVGGFGFLSGKVGVMVGISL